MRTKAKPRQKHKNRKIGGGAAVHVVKCALCGCVLTVICVLTLALLLKWNVVNEGAVAIATSTIKAICAAAAGFLCANGMHKRAWLMGGAGGCAYILITFAAFSIVERVLALNMGLLADVLLGFLAGVAGSALLRLKKA